jgi:Flp pilus assembly protein TadD
MLGAARSLSGDSGGAEQAFDEAVSLNPRSTQLQTNLGIVCLQNKHVEKGIAALEQSVVLGSSDPRVLFTLGSLLGERGEYRKAVEYLRRIPEPEADDAVNFNLGLAYSHLRQFEKARAAYFRAIDHKPGHAEAYFRVGLDYAAQGEPRNAIPWLFRTRSLGGDRPEVDGVLVEQLLRLKYTKTAEDLVNEALERTPRDLLLIVASGDVLRSNGSCRLPTD